MKLFRLPGLVAYVAMAMWLLQIAITPVRAEEATLVQSRAGDHIEEIRAALAAHGANPDARITLAAPNTAILLGAGETLSFDSVAYNPATGRFLIRAAQVAIAGTANSPVIVPVLARTIERNEAITDADIEWVEYADTRATLYISDADMIVGKIARRPLAAGAPLRQADLAAPILIKRGATATIVLEAPGIRLTQSAVALANGGAGDVISFRNINSNAEIKAVVAGPGVAKAPFASRSTVASLQLDQ